MWDTSFRCHTKQRVKLQVLFLWRWKADVPLFVGTRSCYRTQCGCRLTPGTNGGESSVSRCSGFIPQGIPFEQDSRKGPKQIRTSALKQILTFGIALDSKFLHWTLLWLCSERLSKSKTFFIRLQKSDGKFPIRDLNYNVSRRLRGRGELSFVPDVTLCFLNPQKLNWGWQMCEVLRLDYAGLHAYALSWHSVLWCARVDARWLLALCLWQISRS